MFARVKSSVLSGAFGSLLTVFLMYHILKLGVTENYTHYLDSTEITNYTLIESLLLTTTKVPELTPKKNWRSDNIHLSLKELKYLASSYQPVETTTKSILLYYSTLTLLQLQLQAIHDNQIKTNENIHIICETEKEKSTIENFILDKKEKYKVSIKKENNAWFRHVNNIESDYIIMMDKGVIPGQGYFQFITGLLNQPQFHHTLIGTEKTETINICQQTEAHYVNKLNDIYVLRREWYSAFIYQNVFTDINTFLSQQLNIPSIILPKSLTDQQLYGNTKNNCVNVQPNSILFIRESTALDTMICQFSNLHDIIHLVHWEHNNIANISCTSSNNVILSHSVMNMKELNRIIEKILPSVVFYEKTDANNQQQQLVNLQNITLIGLPTKSISQVTPWITDLSLETLQKWHTPKINIIITIGGKRLKELKQLVKNIKKADYLGDDNIELNILMDEKSDQLLNAYVNYNMTWNYGKKNLRHRISGVHPMQIFTEAWYPSNDDEYAVILDDRIELSNSYYIWLKYTLLKYRYSEQQQQINVFGISLYSPRIIDTDPLGRQLLFNAPKTPYLMQIPNSLGGVLYFPEYWREFHDYITARLTDQATVKRGSGQPHLFKDSLLTIAKSNKWISSYRKYFDEMIYMRGYVMLYPPFGSGYSTITSLSKQKMKNEKKLELYISANKLYQTQLYDSVRGLPDLELLPILDLHGKSVKKEELIERGHYLQHKFSACEPILNHLHDPSDMLCPFNHWIQVPIEQITPIPTKTVHILLPSFA